MKEKGIGKLIFCILALIVAVILYFTEALGYFWNEILTHSIRELIKEIIIDLFEHLHF